MKIKVFHNSVFSKETGTKTGLFIYVLPKATNTGKKEIVISAKRDRDLSKNRS